MLQCVHAAGVAPAAQRIPPKQNKLDLVDQGLFSSLLGSSLCCPIGKMPSGVVQETLFLDLCVNVACSDVLQATHFFSVAHEQGLTAAVVSLVQIRGMIFALIGCSLQASVNIFGYLTTLHDSNAELTGFWKFSVRHWHICLSCIIGGQQRLG